MKKGKKIIIIAVILCLLAALGVGSMLFAGGPDAPDPTVPTVVANGDIGWYDENGKEFVITTMEELCGLAELSKTHDFKGQTVKLGADIVVNQGDAATWATQAPEYLWTPIVGFAGTFDGQGHTISGVYGNSIVTSLGLFTNTQKGCVIRNLNLVNSCFKNNNDMGTGSIIGVGGGTLENIYSDAVLVSSGKYVGGLIGSVKAKGENQIINCWFDGTITMDGYDCANVGGLVGAYSVEDAINTITHSLSTADITCMGENVGGICGSVGNSAFLNLSDSMYTGMLVYDTNKYAVVGSVVGQVMGSASIIVSDTYTVDEIANRTIGTSSGYQKGNAIAVGQSYLTGVGGYQWTTLDFDHYWVVQKDGMPRLNYYTEATESIEGVQKMVDISWYDPTGASFEITNMQQLYGFAYLSRSYDFRGQTIKLGADITVNEGDASTWGENAPEYNWTPIAWYGSSLSQRFKGTFDGQGHTISGIYSKGTQNVTCIGLFGEVYHGAVVKNFKLVNSYFEGVLSPDVRGPVGSIAGRLRGTIENVYSDAIVVNSARNTGGIVGMIIGDGENTITGCWFDGQVTGITRTGGILGGVYGNKGNIEATIKHCLNTGDIRVEIGQAAVGGICGSVEAWSILNINDCLNAGTFQTFGEAEKESTHIGTLVGTVTKTDGVGSKALISHSYGVKEFYSKLVGWKYADEGVSQSSVVFTNGQELIGVGGYQWTTLDFDAHWAVRKSDIPVPVAFAETKPSLEGVVRMVDYSWYDPSQETYTISTFQQLYGMARLWDITNLFKGKTILLGEDITINQGNAADWGETAPAFQWEPAKFLGTFDGQGHTISGVYVKGGPEDNYIGFFHRIYQGAVVKNLRLTNSYFEGTMPASERGAVGSIAGRSNGTIDTVYSDAIVVNSARMTGGLVGMITGEGENKIVNSWFNGKITGINRTGGILGGVYGNKENITVTIHTCTNTGDIAVKIGSGDVGGICGIAETGGTLYITDCLNTGTFATIGTDKEANTHIGSIFGSVTERDGVASSVVLNNVYGVKEFYSKLTGWSYADAGISASSAVTLELATLTAPKGYCYAALDYKNAWALNQSGIPVPKAFGSIIPDPSSASGTVDYSWYDENKDVYTIHNAEQLKAFAVLCNAENNYFAGKTILLGADITLNAGNAADWATTAPANVWTPTNFAGTFDGQGHTISGLYVNSTKQYTGFFSTLNAGAVVKNLNIINSYIQGNGESNRSGVGSVAGRNHGTIDTVYSRAILVNSKQMTGGIAGMSTGKGENLITNCWFDGQILACGSTGGILGGTYAASATVEHCLNTGTITVDSGNAIGGLVGYAQSTSTLTVSDSLNAGKTVTGDAVKQVGAILGAVHADATAAINHTYGTGQQVIGYSKNNVTGDHYAVRELTVIQGYGAYQWTTLDFGSENPAWVLKAGAIPALNAFDDTDLSLEEAKKLETYDWYNDAGDGYVISTVEQFEQYAHISDSGYPLERPVKLDENVKEYIIENADQLRGFGMICGADGADYFKGITVKLGADITLNEGNASQWSSTNAPKNVWTPTNFSGIFDGQGHTISGLYVYNTDKQHTGFFGTVNTGATVKDLRLVNSYIEGAYAKDDVRAGVGSIAGQNHGTIDSVYSNAILKNSKRMTGGIAGMVNEGFSGTITNCWFDGQIHGIRGTGGILGGTYNANKVTVEHCLNTGTLNVADGTYYVGGLIGELMKKNAVTVSDSLNAGSLAGTIKSSGAIVGRLDADTALTINDVYAVSEFLANAIGAQSETATVTGSYCLVRDLADIQGTGAYQWTTLDFETKPYWALREGEVPVLNSFKDLVSQTVLEMTDAVKALPDCTWYDASKDVFTITTARQLLGFNSLCADVTDYFNGKTVKLGADITLTGGSKTAPNWTPVRLKGTFDGQGHTISGVYIVTTEKVYTGFFDRIDASGTVKNLRLENSYIEGNGSNARSGVGSIAGRNYGTIDTVYSNAIIKNSKKMTGGIVGMSLGGTITNCWFDGEINAIGSTGGILGGAYGQSAIIEHCLNTGTITVSNGSAYVGGLYGYAEKASTVTISDSLYAGTILKSAESDTVEHVGMIIGGVDTNATLTLNDVYGANTDATNGLTGAAIGVLNGTMTDSNNYAVSELENIKGTGAYQWTTLDFEAKPYWALREGKTPILYAFKGSETVLEVPDAVKTLPDYSWYDAEGESYVLTTARQLEGYVELSAKEGFVAKAVVLGSETYIVTTAGQLLAFNSLCNADDTNYFDGKTIELDADITLNEGNAADWATTAPANRWMHEEFMGTFDGQGHTISGVYVTAGTHAGFFKLVHPGATVKNLRLVNSYIENTKTSGRSGTGSIAGRSYGTIENVYSSAIVQSVKGAQMTGGIVGMIDNNKTGGANKITNCWFDGQIYGGTAIGGILGGSYKANVNIEHCLNTGTIHAKNKAYYVGGLCGDLQGDKCVVTIKDSLSAGKLNPDNPTYILNNSGSLVGRLDNAKSTLLLENTYGITDNDSTYWDNAIGLNKNNATITDNVYAVLADVTGTNAAKLDYTAYWTARDGKTPMLKSFEEWSKTLGK